MADTDASPRDPFRIAVWAIAGFLTILGSLAGLYASQPWPSKESILQLTREIERERADRLKADEASAVDRTRNTLAIQGLQYEVRQLRDEVKWVAGEHDKLRAYVYPQRTGRVLPPPASRLVPGEWPGP